MGQSSVSLFVRRWRQFLANRGFTATAGTLVRGIARRFHPGAQAQSEAASELWRNADAAPMDMHPFDLHYGTDTSGLIWGEDLATGHAHDAWNTAYYGIAPSAFETALQLLLARSPLDLNRFTFIDLGSGKGRAVLLAATYPFGRVLGVELSSQLHSISLENLSRFPMGDRRCLEINFMLADAAAFPWGVDLSGLLLFFLYNPFSRPVLTQFLKKLEADLRRNPRVAYFLCINPELDATLVSRAWITKLWQETITIAPEDQQADRFGSSTESIAAYRARI